jgi:3-phenylpropionate/trans-cinnamate dioxygenase ferredoxin reductase subunit
VLPYQRPPLSKAYLKGPDEALQPLRAQAWYTGAGMQLHLGDPAAAIDRTGGTLLLQSGRSLPYEQLVLATGTRPRRLAALPGDLANVRLLRSAADATALRAELQPGRRLTVLGGGFIGLEVAATAHALGLVVEVLEAAPRLMARSVSPALSEHVLAQHRAAGLALRVGVRVDAFVCEDNRLKSLQVDGQEQPVDLLLLCIGAEPETALAEAAGLAVDNGVVVDACLRSSDPSILAIGDCARFPEAGSGRPLRLESVQNAGDQGRCAAATLLGRPAPFAASPWFWSEQGGMRLQMAGLLPLDTAVHHRPGAQPGSFTLLHYAGERLVCTESVNAPMDHLGLRKLIEAGRHPAPDLASDPAVALKGLLT